MKLLKFKIIKSKLFSIPDQELLFLIQAMMLFNELNTLQRCMSFSNPRIKRKNDIIATALVTQALFFYRILAGKLYEGWHLINKNFYGNKLSKIYHPMLSQEGKLALTEIKKYFGKGSNIILKIRQKYAFHFDLDLEEAKNILKDATKPYMFEILISKQSFRNNKYFISDMLCLVAILSHFKEEKDEGQALLRVIDEIQKVINWFIIFLNDLVIITINKYLGKDFTEIEIPDPRQVKIPCFIK